MSDDAIIRGQKVEKDNLIFEVLGCLDQCSVEIGSAKLKADNELNQVLTEIQKDIASFSSMITGFNDQPAFSRTGAGTKSADGGFLDWLEKQIKQIENQADIPQGFVLSGKSEFETRLSLARVAVRQAERRLVSLNRYQDLPSEILDYFNQLSWFLFLLAISH